MAIIAVTLLGACAPDRGTDTSGATGAGGSPTTAVGGGGGSAGVKFGDLDSPCGKGEAKGATDQGVTDNEIKIGYGDDRGYTASPGLNKEMGDSIEAFIKWCNDQGGINGRKIKGTLYDAALSNANQVMQAACKSEFMMVGHGFAGDTASEGVRVGCNLASVPGFSASPDSAHGPMQYFAMPTPIDTANASWLKTVLEKFPEAKDGMALMQSTLPAGQTANARHTETLKTLGAKPKDCGVTVNHLGEPNYLPFAQKYKDCGAKVLYNVSAPGPGQFNLLKAMDQIGYRPIMIFDNTWYSERVTQWNTAGLGDNLYVPMQFQPFENAAQVPAVRTYIDTVTKNGGKTSLLGMQAASSFLLWATAAKQCGNDLTRQCMINKLSKIEKWSAGGLQAETNPAKSLPPKCSLYVGLKAQKFSPFTPTEANKWNCGELSSVPESAWGGLKLDASRHSIKYDNPKVLKPQG